MDTNIPGLVLFSGNDELSQTDIMEALQVDVILAALLNILDHFMRLLKQEFELGVYLSGLFQLMLVILKISS